MNEDLALAGEIGRVLRPDSRPLLVDYAGPVDARRHWSARHGPHGRFDLDPLEAVLPQCGLRPVESGPAGWLSLHFIRAMKA